MKKILAIVITGIIAAAVSGCNKTLIDTAYKFDTAVLQLPNGEVIEGQIDSWTDFEDGDQIQIKINGVVYLVHSSNAVLIKNAR